jgi:hypothetical protein
MNYNRLLLLIVLAGCQPTYTSGKTQCSDKKQCPTGFSCSDDGTNAVHYCIDNKNLPACASTNSTFYCSQSNTCWSQPGACSTVTYCGTTQNRDYVICATAGYVPDCNGTTCSRSAGVGTGGSSGNKDAGAGIDGTLGTGGSGGSKDAGIGTGGASTGGTGGIKTTVIVGTGGIKGTGGSAGAGGDAGILRDVRTVDVMPDGTGRDLGSTCTTTCPTGQECLSGQCCAPPAAGGNCTVYPLCGCPSGSVCYPSSTTHAMACYTATNLAEGADCTGSSICQAGLGCFGGVCKRYCLSNSDCPSIGGVQSCDQTTWSSDSTNILGVMVCDRVCDPAHPQSPKAPLLSCPTGFNCSSDAAGASYCLKASPLPTGSTCTTEADCSAGYYCTTGGGCQRYCLSNSDCTAGTTCQFTWSPSEYAGSYMVGFCE